MFRMLRRGPAKRAGRPTRVFLRLEDLEGRAHPSGIDGSPPVFTSGQGDMAPANQSPGIGDFAAEEVGNGYFLLTGRVVGENPDGMIVSFGGVGSVQGLSATCNDAGYFSIRVQLRTDGSDDGSIVATVTGADGSPDQDFVYVHPTAP